MENTEANNWSSKALKLIADNMRFISLWLNKTVVVRGLTPDRHNEYFNLEQTRNLADNKKLDDPEIVTENSYFMAKNESGEDVFVKRKTYTNLDPKLKLAIKNILVEFMSILSAVKDIVSDKDSFPNDSIYERLVLSDSSINCDVLALMQICSRRFEPFRHRLIEDPDLVALDSLGELKVKIYEELFPTTKTKSTKNQTKTLLVCDWVEHCYALLIDFIRYLGIMMGEELYFVGGNMSSDYLNRIFLNIVMTASDTDNILLNRCKHKSIIRGWKEMILDPIEAHEQARKEIRIDAKNNPDAKKKETKAKPGKTGAKTAAKTGPKTLKVTVTPKTTAAPKSGQKVIMVDTAEFEEDPFVPDDE